jgi:hypothetical protein
LAKLNYVYSRDDYPRNSSSSEPELGAHPMLFRAEIILSYLLVSSRDCKLSCIPPHGIKFHKKYP